VVDLLHECHAPALDSTDEPELPQWTTGFERFGKDIGA
jgi:hypothetical protein